MIYKGTPTYYNSDIAHYGVKGMKWGVRRSRASLASQSARTSNKIEKLRKAKIGADDKYAKTHDKLAGKAAKYDFERSKLINKASKTSNQSKYDKMMEKAGQLERTSNMYKAKINEAKSKVDNFDIQIKKNQQIKQVLDNTISAMDKGTLKVGQNFMTKYFMKYEDYDR